MKKEALKIMDIYELKERQMMLDNKFKKKMGIKKISPELIKVAYLDEVGELIHELKPLWCYWKKDNKPVDKRRVLEELSDCLHLSTCMVESISYKRATKTYKNINIFCTPSGYLIYFLFIKGDDLYG